jgi:hypothetical protein
LVGYRCSACEHVSPIEISHCPACGSALVGRLLALHLEGSITPAGTLEGVADNPRGDAQFIQYLSPVGGRSDSTLGPSGIELTIAAPIDLGRKGEATVVDRVIAQFRAEGVEPVQLPYRDDRGEDRKICFEDQEVTIQVVAIPGAPDFVAQASRNSASTSVTIDGAARWIYDVIKKKEGQYPRSDRQRMLLAIDARAVGVLVSPSVTSAVIGAYGDLCEQTGFGAIWIVGPSASRCTRLGSCRW